MFVTSDNPEKCCKYAEHDTKEPYLLRCRVIMGDIKVILVSTILTMIINCCFILVSAVSLAVCCAVHNYLLILTHSVTFIM